MDKISHVLPSTARITSVDTKESQPVRPGAPSFGNPEGISPIHDRVSISAIGPASRMQKETAANWKSKEQKQAEIAAKLSRSFFAKNDIGSEPAEVEKEHQPAANRNIAENAAQYKTHELRPGSAWSITEKQEVPVTTKEKVESEKSDSEDEKSDLGSYGMDPAVEKGEVNAERGGRLSVHA